MLKLLVSLLIITSVVMPTFARSNSEIGAQLYNVANKVKETNPTKADLLKSEIASFLIEANMLNFNEDYARWEALPSGWFYDKKTIQHYNLRHIGIYKSPDNLVMGVFDVTCEDINDVQERYYGEVKTTEVYFVPNYKPLRGRSKGFMTTFCK